MSEYEKEEEETFIHCDILESILSRIPLLDLASSSCVSTTWQNAAVSSSLSPSFSIQPWLFLHAHSTTSPHRTTHAYDPRSDLWMQLSLPSLNSLSTVRSSHSSLLYILSPHQFSLSLDPLHLTWRHVDPPAWRMDPIVAVIGSRAVIAAGSCDFSDEPLTVQIYDMNSDTWDTCASMPPIFTEFRTSMWFSTTVSGEKLYIMHKNTGVTFSFDPRIKKWRGPYDLNPAPDVFSSAIGFAGGRIVIVGLCGSPEDVKSVKMLEVEVDNLKCREIGEMPKLLVEKLKGESGEMSSIEMISMADFVFFHHGSDPVEVIKLEVGINGVFQWGVVRNSVVNDRTRMQRLVFSCSIVGVKDLQRVVRSENRRILVKDWES